MDDGPSRRQLVTQFFFLFWWYYFPHYHKRRIPEYKVGQSIYARHPRLLIVDARDHGKSVFWSCGYPLWGTLTNPYDQPAEDLPSGGFRYERGYEEIICHISAAGDLPLRWMRQHKIELTFNKLLIRDWGEQSTRYLPDGIWQNDQILLKNGAMIYSKGSGAQIRGDHPTELVVDDLEDRERSQKPENRKKDRLYFFADLYGALEPRSRLKVIGTFVHQEALLKMLFDKEIPIPAGLKDAGYFTTRWKKFKYSALLPDGEPLAPEIWSREELLIRKAELQAHAPGVWETEYMNNPQSSESPIFPELWFQRMLNHYSFGSAEFQERILPKLEKVSFCDPAATEKETNDYTAIVTLGLWKPKDIRPKVYCLQVKRFRTSSIMGQLQEALDTWIKWRGKIGFEGIAYQSILKGTFEEVCKTAHFSPKVYQTNYHDYQKEKGKKRKPLDKVSRANKITYFWEYGIIYFNYDDPMQVILMDDLKVFPTGEFDDTVDSLVGGLWEIDRIIEVEKVAKAPTVQITYDPTSGQPAYVIDRDDIMQDYD
jgi:hypothetical protein